MAGRQIDFFAALGLPPAEAPHVRRPRSVPGFEAPKNRTVFAPESGKLYLFDPTRIEVRIGWPRPQAWRKTLQSPWWSHCRPDIYLPAGDLRAALERASRPPDPSVDHGFADLTPAQQAGLRIAARARVAWNASIPVEVRGAIAPFPTRHWHLLSLIARCGPAALDLVGANPALAFALASSWVFRREPVRRPLRSARALLAPGRKQRDIQAWLGFPASEPARRLLRKVVHDAIGIPPLLYLREAMGDPVRMKFLAHLPRLNAEAIRIGTDTRLLAHVRPSFLEEVALAERTYDRPHAAFLLEDTVEMYQQLRPADGPLPPVRHLAALAELHDGLVEDLNRLSPEHGEVTFPPPPVAGTATIVPICSGRELVEEGRLQSNCVASYWDRIAIRHHVYIYRVLAPERCTLSLTRVGMRWVPSELQRACNLPVSEATRRAVAAWLASNAA